MTLMVSMYSLARTTIHSADFGSGSYTYIEEGDTALSTFSIEHDRQFRIPLIKRAIEAAGGELLMYASPWSPPAFMKDNEQHAARRQVIAGVLPALGKLLHKIYQRPTRKKVFRSGVLPFKTSRWPHSAGSRRYTALKKSVIS